LEYFGKAAIRYIVPEKNLDFRAEFIVEGKKKDTTKFNGKP
jgi:hypothetical protein